VRAIRAAEAVGASHDAMTLTNVTSPYCRCIDTGRLAFDRATPVPYPMPPGVVSERQAAANNERVLQEILNHRGPSNLVIINITNLILEDTVAMGESFVLQPKGAEFTVIAKIQRYAQ